MHIFKPADTLTLLGYQSRGGRPSLTLTVGYVCERDGTRVSESEALAWLMPQFAKEPFDMGLKRKRGSFAMAGCAYAPAGRAVPGLTVSVQAGTLRKQLLVHGNRRWTHGPLGWRASEPEPFFTQPIGLSHAYGARGWPDNPYGIGRLTDTANAEGCALPNVEQPGAPMLAPADVVPVATFGPLPQCSTACTRWLGALDQAWQNTRFPWLPDDTDPRWYDRVPQDQCIASYWRGDEAWSVTHMHPDLPELSGVLPGLRPRLLVHTLDSPEQRRELPLDLDTLWFFPNQSRVVLLYRAEFAVHHEDASDVAGAAVFTERMTDPALSGEHYAQLWRRQSEGAVGEPAPPDAPASKAKAAEAQPAKKDSAAQTPPAPPSEISRVFAAEQKSMLDEIDAYWLASGVKGMREKFLANSAAAEAQDASTTVAAHAASGDTVRAGVEAAFKEGEDEMRQHLSRMGIDLDARLAAAHAQPQPELEPLHVIANLPIADEKKEALSQSFKALTNELDAMEKARAVAGITTPPDQQQADPAARRDEQPTGGMPPNAPRQRLDRDELMARHRAGLSASWTELEGLDLSGMDLSGIDLSRAVLRACTLRGAILNRARLDEAQIENCDLSAAEIEHTNLTRTRLDNCRLERALLRDSDLTQARLKDCQLDGALLTGGQWHSAALLTCSLERANLANIRASNAIFSTCRLTGANASEAVLDWARFDQCALDSACFDGATLTSALLVACKATATRFAQARLGGLRTIANTDLSGAHFDGADLNRASLQNAMLKESSLREAQLNNALVKDCDLSGSNAWHMVARQANFTGCRIAGASWRGANLMQASFARATLENVDLSGCNLHAAMTRTATAQGVLLHQALLTRCRLLKEYAN
jgi:uncharacterized protein YjbI with pentapeptide repeats